MASILQRAAQTPCFARAVYHSATMGTFDPAGTEFLRMSERYRQMSDEELLVLMPQSAELTPFAQQALANEVRSRGLKAEVEGEKPSVPLAPSSSKPRAFERQAPRFRDSAGDDSLADSSDEGAEPQDGDLQDEDPQDEDQYDEDRKLVELCTVWSARDALKLQTILEGAGIPLFMGPEKATSVDRVTSNFSNGVSVQIMQIGLPWARSAMAQYEPEDDQTPKDTAEPEEVAVSCPQCHSEEVVFEGLTSEPAKGTDDSSQKYQWKCDSCGHQWEDDGVAKEG
ncbi:MAG: hypothetical protein ABSB87_00570 [Terriglobales bacterium]